MATYNLFNHNLGSDSKVLEIDYLFGHCHVFAIALHRLTDRPLLAALAYDDDIESQALVHCWVRLDDETVLDASGLTTTTQSLRRYPDGGIAKVADVDCKALISLGEGQAPDLIDLERRIEDAILIARTLLQSDDVAAALQSISAEEPYRKEPRNMQVPAPSEFVVDKRSISNNYGANGEVKLTCQIEDHLFEVHAALDAPDSTPTNGDDPLWDLSVELLCDGDPIARYREPAYVYHGDTPGQHLYEEVRLGLNGAVMGGLCEHMEVLDDSFDFSALMQSSGEHERSISPTSRG